MAKKNLAQRLFVIMTGSVVTTDGNKSARGKRSGKSAPKSKPAKKARPAPKARTGNLVQLPECPEETDLKSGTVELSKGVRNKLWIDDALKAVNHTVRWLRALPAMTEVPVEVFASLKEHLLQQVLLFAFKGSVLLDSSRGGRVHRKWSSLRPALPAHASHWVIKVGDCIFLVVVFGFLCNV